MTYKRPVVIILIGAFWPGSESTGPNQSIRGLCEALGSEFDFRIVARDRSFDATSPLADSTGWHDLGYALVRYLPPGHVGAQDLIALLRTTRHDLVHMNGFFDREFTIPTLLARRVGRLKRVAAIISPRGEFSTGALALNARVKWLYLKAISRLGFLRGVRLHTTSAAEDLDVAATLPRVIRARADNIRSLPQRPAHSPRQPNAPFRAVFVGRISRVKGVHTALQALAGVSIPVAFDIYGPISDPTYWKECQQLIAALPAHICARACGEVANSDVVPLLAHHDCLLLPSRSENFGHAIFESLAAGTPVIIGQRTPWRDLERRAAGIDVPLDQPGALTNAIERMAASSPAWRTGARQVVERYAENSSATHDTKRMYLNAMRPLAFEKTDATRALSTGGHNQ